MPITVKSGSSFIGLKVPRVFAMKLADCLGDKLPKDAKRVLPDAMHLTLLYLGQLSDVQGRQAVQAVEQASHDLHVMRTAGLISPRVTCTVSGITQFVNNESDERAIVMLIDCPDLEDVRHAVRHRVRQFGFEPPRTHGFCAHVSVAYSKTPVTLPAGLPSLSWPIQKLRLIRDKAELVAVDI